MGVVLPMFAADGVTGAWNQTWAATAPVEGKAWTSPSGENVAKGKTVKTGEYYTPVAKEGGDNKISKDVKLAGELWEWTEGELRERGY